MIPERFKDRSAGDSGVDLATRKIVAVFPDGEKRLVVLRLGSPFARDGMVAIRVELENLDRTDGPICGGDSFQALVLGLGFIVGRLAVFEQRHGCRYEWPETEGGGMFDYRTLLSTTDILDRLPPA